MSDIHLLHQMQTIFKSETSLPPSIQFLQVHLEELERHLPSWDLKKLYRNTLISLVIEDFYYNHFSKRIHQSARPIPFSGSAQAQVKYLLSNLFQTEVNNYLAASSNPFAAALAVELDDPDFLSDSLAEALIDLLRNLDDPLVIQQRFECGALMCLADQEEGKVGEESDYIGPESIGKSPSAQKAYFLYVEKSYTDSEAVLPNLANLREVLGLAETEENDIYFSLIDKSKLSSVLFPKLKQQLAFNSLNLDDLGQMSKLIAPIAFATHVTSRQSVSSLLNSGYRTQLDVMEAMFDLAEGILMKNTIAETPALQEKLAVMLSSEGHAIGEAREFVSRYLADFISLVLNKDEREQGAFVSPEYPSNLYLSLVNSLEKIRDRGNLVQRKLATG